MACLQPGMHKQQSLPWFQAAMPSRDDLGVVHLSRSRRSQPKCRQHSRGLSFDEATYLCDDECKQHYLQRHHGL